MSGTLLTPARAGNCCPRGAAVLVRPGWESNPRPPCSWVASLHLGLCTTHGTLNGFYVSVCSLNKPAP